MYEWYVLYMWKALSEECICRQRVHHSFQYNESRKKEKKESVRNAIYIQRENEKEKKKTMHA